MMSFITSSMYTVVGTCRYIHHIQESQGWGNAVYIGTYTTFRKVKDGEMPCVCVYIIHIIIIMYFSVKRGRV